LRLFDWSFEGTPRWMLEDFVGEVVQVLETHLGVTPRPQEDNLEMLDGSEETPQALSSLSAHVSSHLVLEHKQDLCQTQTTRVSRSSEGEPLGSGKSVAHVIKRRPLP